MAINKKAFVTRFIQEVWTDGNVEAADSYVARQYTIHHDPGDPWEGQTLDLAGFKDRVRQSRAPFPDQRFTIRALIGERDKMVATWLWQGTHAGDVPGFPASGKHVTMSGVTVYSFEGAKLSGHWQVADRLSIFRQLSGQPG